MSAMKHLSDDTRRSTRERLIARGAELQELLHRDAAEAGASIEMSRIEQALARFNSGTFAICEACGGEIEERQLSASPLSTRCRRCAPDA